MSAQLWKFSRTVARDGSGTATETDADAALPRKRSVMNPAHIVRRFSEHCEKQPADPFQHPFVPAYVRSQLLDGESAYVQNLGHSSIKMTVDTWQMAP
jgi:hypothetical protein